MTDPDKMKTCPTCGATVSQEAKQCPECGAELPAEHKEWYKNLTPTEVFLLILGSIMLMIAVVAL